MSFFSVSHSKKNLLTFDKYLTLFMKGESQHSISKSRLLLSAVEIILFILICNSVIGQKRWNVEIRPSVNIANQKTGGSELKTGFGAEATLGYLFLKNLGVYGGWGWNRFAANHSSFGDNVEFVETGYTVGISFIHSFDSSNVQFLVRSGIVYNHIEFNNSKGNLILDTDYGLGWQVEAGFAFVITNNFKLVPTVRFHTLSRDLKSSEIPSPLSLKYVSLGIGGQLQF